MTQPFSQHKHANQLILANPEIFPEIKADYFEADYWHERSKVTGTAGGRGVATFFNHNHHQLVLKRYLRGGLFGKLVKQSYLTFNAENNRAYKEFELLYWMKAQGLPCPTPAAAMITLLGPITRASLITEKVANAKDLVVLLQQSALDDKVWFKVGQMIKRFHHAGIYHSDLNAHNILLDDKGELWLIDFDKCERREKAGLWQGRNLARLLRSLEKESNRLSNFHWSKNNWINLTMGYSEPVKS